MPTKYLRKKKKISTRKIKGGEQPQTAKAEAKAATEETELNINTDHINALKNESETVTEK